MVPHTISESTVRGIDGVSLHRRNARRLLNVRLPVPHDTRNRRALRVAERHEQLLQRKKTDVKNQHIIYFHYCKYNIISYHRKVRDVYHEGGETVLVERAALVVHMEVESRRSGFREEVHVILPPIHNYNIR